MSQKLWFILILSMLIFFLNGSFMAREVKRAFFNDVQCVAHNHQLVKKLDCNLKPGMDGVAVMNANFTLSNDTDNIVSHYNFSIIRNGKRQTYLAVKTDICAALTGTFSNIVLALILKEVRRVTNYPFQCPFKKDINYYMNNFTIHTYELPSYTPEMKWHSYALLTSHEKPSLDLSVYGKIIKYKPKSRKINQVDLV